MGNSAERTESGEETDRTAILGLLDRWRLATRAKDIDAILELVTDDVVFLPSSPGDSRQIDDRSANLNFS